ncbi:hypothetical protein [Rhizobium halophilum]|uniref:hypothetical protein n=1 Tax=Rhizobium halophilum TaxID=2846852 RepID=UPI001EFEE5C2|nr:hypothetical protein [Rhizobium halophilum]MCF6370059.1 hypothetical protein [Rhizobium halophilum]
MAVTNMIPTEQEVSTVDAETALQKLARLQEEAQTAAQSHSINRQKLELMTMKELNILHSAVDPATEALVGVLCQPRSSNEADDRYNGAGNEISDLIDHLDRYKTTILDVTKHSEPTTVNEVRDRAWLLLRAETQYEECLYQFTKLVGEQVALLAEVGFAERRQKL